MTDPIEAAPDQLLLLIDPAWTPTDDRPDPPAELLVGGWVVQADGTAGRFQANPGYTPSTPGSPTDPMDAVLHLITRGSAGAAELMSVMHDIDFAVALDENGIALVAPAPDGPLSILVTTSVAHRARVRAADWRELTLPQLAAALPATGVDVLVNPGGPASMRLLADAVRDAAAGETYDGS